MLKDTVARLLWAAAFVVIIVAVWLNGYWYGRITLMLDDIDASLAAIDRMLDENDQGY